MSVLWFFAVAAGKVDPGSIGLNNPAKDANAALASILSTVYAWAGILCVIIIIIAGYYYTNSSGDSAGITRAKQAIIGSVVGLIVILMAFVVTQFMLGRF
jgi:Ni,Fe-hydrogenase I cytochrome b subunit